MKLLLRGSLECPTCRHENRSDFLSKGRALILGRLQGKLTLGWPPMASRSPLLNVLFCQLSSRLGEAAAPSGAFGLFVGLLLGDDCHCGWRAVVPAQSSRGRARLNMCNEFNVK